MANIFYYGFINLIILFFRQLYYRIKIPNSRFIRGKIDLRGFKSMKFGNGFTCGIGCRFETRKKNSDLSLSIGENVQFNDYIHITAYEKVEIGDNVLMASKIYISDCSHGSYKGNELDSNPSVPPNDRKLFTKPVIIGNNVWIGEFVSILPGVTIGDGSIIGSNSVVSKNIPSNVIAVGTPAKPIKKFNFQTAMWEKI